MISDEEYKCLNNILVNENILLFLLYQHVNGRMENIVLVVFRMLIVLHCYGIIFMFIIVVVAAQVELDIFLWFFRFRNEKLDTVLVSP